jgi:hypothetical protein
MLGQDPVGTEVTTLENSILVNNCIEPDTLPNSGRVLFGPLISSDNSLPDYGVICACVSRWRKRVISYKTGAMPTQPTRPG